VAVGEAVVCRLQAMDGVGGGRWGPHVSQHASSQLVDDLARRHRVEEEAQSGEESRRFDRRSRMIPYLCDLRHIANEPSTAASPAAEFGVSARWRMKDRVSAKNLAVLENLFPLACFMPIVVDFGRIMPVAHP
jgi:hypothetical protein